MKYITAVFYTIDGRDMVIYKPNFHGCNKLASALSNKIETEFLSANKAAKNVHARTFELEVPSYDLR